MDEATQIEVARELSVARRHSTHLTAHAVSRLVNMTDAYGVQERVREQLGAKVIGWKLAEPTPGNVISAPLFDTGRVASNAVLVTPALLRDGIECELALRVDRALTQVGCRRDDVMEAIGAVMPAFELLCSRLPSGFASPREQIVADCMGQGAVVLGSPCREWKTLQLDRLRVTLTANDAVVVDKQGGSPFGDPLRAVALLVDHLARRGLGLEAGQFVLAGSHTGVHRAQPGDRLLCAFEGIGQVALSLGKMEEQGNVGR